MFPLSHVFLFVQLSVMKLESKMYMFFWIIMNLILGGLRNFIKEIRLGYIFGEA